MSDWVPFFQALIWPAFIGAAMYLARVDLSRIGRAVVARIEQGDSIEAGTSGIKLGASGRPRDPEVSLIASDETRESKLPNKMYLIHSAKRDRRLDKDGREYYRVQVWLDADDPSAMNDVAAVTYHLHPTFRDPIRIAENRDNDFLLSTAAWGQFNMYAEIKYKSERPALVIERYINF